VIVVVVVVVVVVVRNIHVNKYFIEER